MAGVFASINDLKKSETNYKHDPRRWKMKKDHRDQRKTTFSHFSGSNNIIWSGKQNKDKCKGRDKNKNKP